MAVIVPLRIESAGRSRRRRMGSAALVNTGYRAESTEVALPAAAATRLGLWPRLPASARQIGIRSAGGRALLWDIPNAVRVGVDVKDRKPHWVTAHVLITPDQDEILISDALAEALGLNILSPKKGHWRFRDDPPGLERESMPAQSW